MTNGARSTTFDLLLASLPDESDQSIEAQARRILRLILEREPESRPATSPNPRTCPNCDKPVDAKRSPYCGEQCREVAGFIRQFRTGLTLGWIMDLEKQVALGQNLWDILGGGRPLRREIAPKRSVEKALARENGICQSCGAPATTIDHYGSGCNRPINLRPVCADCCADRDFLEPGILNAPRAQEALTEIATRIRSEAPLRICDDADSWDWRRYLNERQAAMLLT